MTTKLTLGTEAFDCWADGELSIDDQQHLLRLLEHDPTAWKPLALAFIERDALRQAMRPLQTESIEPMVPKETRSQQLGQAAKIMLAVTVCGLAFLAGRLVRPDSMATRPTEARVFTSSIETPDVLPGDSRVAEATEQSAVHHTLRVIIPDEAGTPAHAMDVPVISAASALETQWANRALITPELQVLLRQQGRKASEQPGYFQIPLADGGNAVLPVRNVSVSPLTMSDFQ